MARSFNQVVLMGNLTRDPELRTTPSGQSVCSFSLALNRQWKGQDGQTQEAVDYIDVVAWAGLGERVAQYCQKGKPVLVNGRLQSRSWEQDGQKRNKVEVLAQDVTFLGTAGGDGAERSNKTSDTKANSSDSKKDEDIVIDEISENPIDLSDIPF